MLIDSAINLSLTLFLTAQRSRAFLINYGLFHTIIIPHALLRPKFSDLEYTVFIEIVIWY